MEANASKAPGAPVRKRPLRERFPGLARLEVDRAKIPFVQQLTMADCGSAALAMTLGYYGKELSLEKVRTVVGFSRDGASAASILDAANFFGLRGRAVSVDLDGLSFLTRGSILHWSFSHWVVLDQVETDRVRVVDPAAGPRAVPMPDFRRHFTGVALLLEPGDRFESESRARWTGVSRYVMGILEHSRLLSRIVVISLFLRVLALALPGVTGIVVDRIIPRSDYGLFQVVAIGLGAILVFQTIASLLRSLLNLHLRTQIDAEMTLDFIDHLVGLPYDYFQLRTPGDLMVRMSSNARVREIVTAGLLASLLDGVLACVYLGLLFIASPLMGGVAAVLAFARVLMLLFTRRKQRELQSRSLEVQGRATSQQMELLSGMETLKALGVEQRAAEHYSNVYVESLNVGLEQGRVSAWLEAGIAALDLLSPLVVLAVGTSLVLSGSLNLGTMLALAALTAAFLGPLSSLVSALTNLQLLGSYVERINEVFETPREQAVDGIGPSPTLTGQVRLENVSFSYSSSSRLVLKDVSLEIPAGECIAIVGRSGSGKTTLGRLLVGLYKPSSGRITFDGRDLESLEYRSVRRQVGTVAQRTALFAGSIKSNIAYGHENASRDEVVTAAKLANMHDEIAALPLGYETPLASDGGSLSGGQRQRLALARALLGRPPILLLDEATSSLDAVTERRVQDNLARLRCTRIIIAHRLSTVRSSDRVLVMDDGMIVESGSHGELLAKNGLYAELVGAQMGSTG
jgi:ATP-binding cassette, subfamily B, bacterial